MVHQRHSQTDTADLPLQNRDLQSIAP